MNEQLVVVDGHHHLWDPTQADYPWLTDDLATIRRAFTTDDLDAAVAECDATVSATVLVQTRSSEDETRLFLRIGGPVAGVVGWVDLTAADVAERIGALREGPGGDRLVGLRHQVHDEPDPDWLDRPEVRRGLGAVAETGLAYDLLVRTRELPAAVRLARDLPGLRLVLDHLGKPPLTEAPRSDAMLAWSGAVRALAANPNVAAKVSGLVTEADWSSWSAETLRPAVDVAVAAFGPSRLLFGSDWPVCLLATTYARWLSTARNLLAEHLSGADERAVFGQNAVALYRGALSSMVPAP